MVVLGISGLFTTESDDYDPATFYRYSHDAAACLIENGKTLAAVEEERLNRDKHTFRFPSESVKACLEISGVKPVEITAVAYYFEEQYVDVSLSEIALHDPHMTADPVRDQLSQRLSEATGQTFSGERLRFADHH